MTLDMDFYSKRECWPEESKVLITRLIDYSIKYCISMQQRTSWNPVMDMVFLVLALGLEQLQHLIKAGLTFWAVSVDSYSNPESLFIMHPAKPSKARLGGVHFIFCHIQICNRLLRGSCVRLLCILHAHKRRTRQDVKRPTNWEFHPLHI